MSYAERKNRWNHKLTVTKQSRAPQRQERVEALLSGGSLMIKRLQYAIIAIVPTGFFIVSRWFLFAR